MERVAAAAVLLSTNEDGCDCTTTRGLSRRRSTYIVPAVCDVHSSPVDEHVTPDLSMGWVGSVIWWAIWVWVDEMDPRTTLRHPAELSKAIIEGRLRPGAQPVSIDGLCR